ncbi:amidase family protein [Deinococcus koreensis]|uniref:Amidase n=1 Tax=Deinococcus koreensis TaxID=2054903 RepID=A0A2K3V1S9_9DEIO|nr:amidase family protein [Deinococcus koreensis]PNY82734.1 amidase [Deinococcus koreensis]
MTPDLLTLDATSLADATRRGEVLPSAATRAYLERLNALNGRLRAVITVSPSAQAEADTLDGLPDAQRGALHGVPMLIKDNLDVAGLPTTAGSVLMRSHVPAQDAPVVARLRAAGAVILGKANMTEWANFMTVGMPNGYSSHGGQTVNPWGEGLDTGGSSSGSGVAVAARLCAAAIGTETSGSIVSPAHQNGVVGLKPSMGLVPRTGIVPISSSQDTAGPITRSVRDAALILGVIAGPDERDPVTLTPPTPEQSPVHGLQGAVIGLIRDELHATSGESAALEQVEAALRGAGATVRDVTFPSRAELEAAGWMLEVLEYEFRGDLNAYLAGVTDGPRTLAEVIEGNDADPARALRFGQTLLHAAQGTRGDASEPHYAQARARDLDLTRTRGFDPLFASGLHAVVFPGIHGYGLAAKAGYPSLALPTTPAGRKPGGVLLVAPAGGDHALLALAGDLSGRLGGVTLPEL